MVTLDLIPAQVRARNLAEHVAQISQDIVHISYGKARADDVYLEGMLKTVAEARGLLDFIEAAATAWSKGPA